MKPSSILLPGKSYFTSVHASITPNITFITAAMNEHPMLVANAYITFFLVISSKNSAGESLSEYTITEAKGIRTISDSIVTVIPNVSLKPGITLVFFTFFNFTVCVLSIISSIIKYNL